jgi:hypothetical protein
MKQKLYVTLLLFCSLIGFAQLNVGGINYTITSVTAPLTVKVASHSSFTGAANIPATVTDGTNTYTVTSIGEIAFYNCSGLTSVTIPNSVTSIGNYAFQYCSGLTSVTIPNSVTSIGNFAFDTCLGFTSVTIPNSVTSIGHHAFNNCSGLTSVTIPSSVTSIGEVVFALCSGLTSVTIPNSVTSIGAGAFLGCSSLTAVNIPNSVTSIGAGAFLGCSGLTSVTIPNSVTLIGDSAFSGCSALTSVTVGWTTPLAINANVFANVNLPNATLYVPAGTLATYEAAPVWTDFGTILEINAAPTDIALSAMAINENVAANSTVGTFSTTDPDTGNTFAYSLVGGTGSTDNGAFTISGNSLTINNSPDFETQSSYTIRVRTTDQGNQFFEKQFTIAINNLCEIVLTPASQTNLTCNGAGNGAASVNVPTGGTPPYTYNWSPGTPSGDGTPSVTGLNAGNRTCTVTDANGCLASQTFTITQPTGLGTTIGSQTNVTCFGGTNGSATANGSGGTAPYTYSWSNGNTTATITNITAGTYTLTVTDANGCTTNRPFTITQPASALSATATQTNVLCFGGNNGAINVTPSGGTAPYTYNWGGGITTEDRTNLTAGSYSCIITDANGCTSTQNFTITQPTQITATATQTNVTCFGGNDGAINLTPSGGTAPYTYNWNNFQTTNPISNLSEGVYSCIIYDADGCTSTQNFTITQPSSIPAPTGLAIQVYAGTSTIAALTATGTTIQWYDAASAGSLLPNTTALVDGTTYYASQTTTCGESTTRLAVTVRKISEATQTLCSNATVGNLVSTPSTGTTAKWFTTSTGGTALDNTTTLTAGTYYVEQEAPATVTQVGNHYLSYDVAVQSNGNIFFTVPDTDYNAVNIMNTDGLDIGFIGGFISPYGVAIQSDGKILVAEIGGSNIKRMNADGTNLEFLGSGFSQPRDVVVQNDGKILVADPINNAIKRMNADGSNIEILGSGFNFPNSVTVQNDGKIIVADSYNNAVKKMNADGSNIVTLGSGFNQPYGVAVQNDGKIIITEEGSFNVKRMNADGSNVEIIANLTSFGRGITVQNDGKILVATLVGIKRITNGPTSNRVAVTVNINAAPTAPTVTTPVTYNINDTATALTATTGGTGLAWYTAATGGTALTSAPTPTATTGGTTSYWVASTAANGCESTRVEIVVIVNQPANYLHFDGVNDYIALPTSAVNIPSGNSPYTIEAMIKPSVLGGIGIVGWGDYGQGNKVNAFRLSPTGLVNYWWGADFSVDTPISTTAWSHVAVTYDGAFRKMYVNGVQVGGDNTPTSELNVTNTTNVTIGTTNTSEYFNGGIDDVRIWNVARTETEINDKKACELDGNETGLVAYYKFNQGNSGVNNATITTATSTTGNNVGTLTNYGLTAGSSNWLAGSPIVSDVTCTLLLGNTSFEVGNNLKIYPNPTQNIVNIDLQDLDNASVEVYDINGRQLFTQKLNNTTTAINIENLASGVYLFKVSSSQGTATIKVVKQE